MSELAAGISDPQKLEELQQQYPDTAFGGEIITRTTDDGAAMYLHELPVVGALVVDDEGAVHLARPPKTAGAEWLIAGQQ